jgi:hypothetical protein
MRRFLALVLSATALSIAAIAGAATVAAESAPSFTGGQRLVMALYYPWYDEGTWESGTTADRPLVPYASWHRETIERHTGWAKDAGIEVLVSAWFGPRDNNPTENNLKTLLDVAKPTGLKAAILLETDSNEFFPDRGSLVQGLRHALLAPEIASGSVGSERCERCRCIGRSTTGCSAVSPPGWRTGSACRSGWSGCSG